MKRAGIDFNALDEYTPTSPLAKYTGAGVIFGATGGVMEAALRTVAHILVLKMRIILIYQLFAVLKTGLKKQQLRLQVLMSM